MQIRGTGANGAAAGGAEGNDGLAGKVVAFQESANNPRGLPVPNGIADEYHVVLVHVCYRTGDSGPGGGVVLLPVGAAGAVGVIQVGTGVGLLGGDFIEVSIGQSSLDVVSDVLRVVGAGEVGDQRIALVGSRRWTWVRRGGWGQATAWAFPPCPAPSA